MIQIDTDQELCYLEPTPEVRSIGDIMPDVLALHGLHEAEPEIEVELSSA